MRRLILFAALSAFLCNLLNAQSFRCGTVGKIAEQVKVRLIENKAAIANGSIIKQRSTVYVPIKFHLIAKDDGSRRIAMSRVFDQVCELNSHFADQNIQFYIKDNFNFIDNTLLYSNHQLMRNIMAYHADPKALNVFVLEYVDINYPDLAGYYNTSSDWIVLRNADIGRDHALSHEIGHYFSLLHPFHGWDGEPYDEEVHGIPAPVFSPMGLLTEKMDHTNCETAGDMLCDTPADFNFFGWKDCNYKGGALDPGGMEVDPEEKLFMNYFSCRRGEYFFSVQQKEVMYADLFSSRRNNIRGTTPNSTATIPNKPTLMFPTGGQISDHPSSVDLFWTDVSGATNYVVEIDDAPNFSGDHLKIMFTDRNSVTVTGLQPGKLYFWRVKPYNEYYTCQDFSKFANFKTDVVSSTTNIRGLSGFQVSPNPIRHAAFNIAFHTEQSFVADVKIVDISGKIVQQFGSMDFPAGRAEKLLRLSSSVTNGVYILHLYSQHGYLTEKLLVLR